MSCIPDFFLPFYQANAWRPIQNKAVSDNHLLNMSLEDARRHSLLLPNPDEEPEIELQNRNIFGEICFTARYYDAVLKFNEAHQHLDY